MKFDFASRLEKLKKLVGGRADALLLSAGEGFDANAYYYSGDETHPTLLLVSRDYSAIFSLHAQDFSHVFDDCFPLKNARKKLSELAKKMGVKKLGVDDFSASAGSAIRLANKLKINLVPLGEKLGELRVLKDSQEISCIKKACSITLHALAEIAEKGFVGKAENQLAGFLEERARGMGAGLDAFPPMVLSGKRACLFHNSTSNKKILANEAVLVDCGARYNYYCADYTRVFFEGKSKKIIDAINAVEEAKNAAVKKALKGVATGEQLNKLSLKVIQEYGFGKYSHKNAGHGIGHFIGLNVHDGGDFSKTRLRPGMAFTIEPGIYVPGEFGVRVEDTIVLE